MLLRQALCLLVLASVPALARDEVRHRLVVAEAAPPAASVWDAEDGRLLARFPLPAAPRIAAGENGVALLVAGDEVHALDTGLQREDHGDHHDLMLAEPRLLPGVLRGARPAHVALHNGVVAAFLDGEGAALVTRLEDWRAAPPQPRRIATARPHHGAAIVLAGQPVISVPAPGTASLPDAAAADGAGGPGVPCPRLHGQAATGPLVAFGCADGLAVFESRRDGMSARHLPYPPGAPAGRMVRNLRGAAEVALLVGDWGPDALVLVEPDAAAPFRPLPLPGRRAAFALPPEGLRVVAWLRDGRLLSFDTADAAPRAAATLPPPSGADPALAAAGALVAVADAGSGEVSLRDAGTLAERARIRPGVPLTGVWLTGGAGRRH